MNKKGKNCYVPKFTLDTVTNVQKSEGIPTQAAAFDLLAKDALSWREFDRLTRFRFKKRR